MAISKFAAKLAMAFAAFALVSQSGLSQLAAPKSLSPAAAIGAPAPGHIHTTAAPAIRVVGKVDDSKRTTLYGHVSSAVRSGTDLGRLDPSTQSQHMVLVLKSSDEQKHELRRVLDEQQDKNTANYHQWVTPDQFGQYFGVHDSDIAQITAWLESHGLTVDDVSKSKRVLHFSGTTGQLESAFKTEMHTYQVGAETHVSNNSDISVPAALSPVIAGVTLNNFFRRSRMTPVRHLKDVIQSPNYTSSSTVHYVGPWDFAKIYNTFPLLNQGITGAGSSIAIVGRSDILMSDVQSYRTLFGLPVNDPIFIHAGQDNGTQPGDDGESDLDVEISGGIAQNAQVYFVIGTPLFLVDGITNSIEYIVENNTADIMSISYGSCESVEGVGGNEFNSQAFEQAAAQGISIFVAAGDNGPAECDDQNDSYENLGYSTGGESSTPYNVSAGGTGLAESITTAIPTSPAPTSTTGPEYWSATTETTAPYYLYSALSYIPETPWNIAKDADYSADGTVSGLWSGSGGISSYYIQPSWQRGSGVPTTDPVPTQGGDWVTGITITNPGSGYTSAPTVTFGAGCLTAPSATATISGGVLAGVTFNFGSQGGTLKAGQGFGCTSTPTVTFSAAPAGGTTATGTATIGPMWNTLPLVSGVPHRYTPDIALNADDGNDPTLFCSEGACEFTTSSSGAVTLSDAGLVGGTSVAAPSMAGVQALINQANGGRQGAPNYIYYTLSAAQTESGCNSAAEVYNAPTVGSTCAFHDITLGDNLICGESTCTKGTYPSALSTTKMGWLAGTGYDFTTGLGSVNVYNLAKQWSTVTFNSSDTTLSLSQTTGIAQGTPITISGTVTAGSGNGTPTGDVAFILSNGIFGQTLDISGDANDGSFNGPGAFATLNNGSYSATLSNLPGGSYTITARYAGDANFASSLSTPVPVTVAAGNTPVITITPQYPNDISTCELVNQSTYNYGQLVWIPVNVASSNGSGVPTGTVTITVDGATWATVPLDPNGNAYLIAGAVYTNSCLYDYIFSQGPFLTGGNHSIGASYSGDGTFSPFTATPVNVTVNRISVTPTLSLGAQTITSGFTEPLVASFASSLTTGAPAGASGPTGTVTFNDTTTSTTLGTATVIPTVVESILATSTTTYPSYTYPATAAGSTALITASGANSITASYGGDLNYAPTTSAAGTVTVDATAPTATTTVVSSSSNPTTLAGRPTFTATIGVGSGTAPTSGTVTFYDNVGNGTVLLGTGTVGTAHTATFRPGTTPAFVGGAHSITAVYGGIAADGPSTSPVFIENVTKGTGTIKLSGKESGTVGQAFTFAAVLTPSTSNAVYPPNLSTVQFFDGATNIGSAQPQTINEDQGGYGLWTASFSTSSLAAGTHTITATYSDTNFNFSTSNAITVVVGSAAPTPPFGSLEQARDALAGGSTVSTSDPLLVAGWVGDSISGSTLRSVTVYIDGVSKGTPTLGIPRPDVAAATGNSAYLNSGYEASYSVAAYSAGSHSVTVVAVDSAGLVTTFGPLAFTVTTTPPASLPLFGNIEQVLDANTGKTPVSQLDSVFVAGWVADPNSGATVNPLVVNVDGVAVSNLSMSPGLARTDVAAIYGSAYLDSGFQGYFPASQLTAGTHKVSVLATDSSGNTVTFGPTTITVTAAPPFGNLEEAVDLAVGGSMVSTADSVGISGWVADEKDGAPLSNVTAYIDGTAIGTPDLGYPRTDVVAAYNNSAYLDSGYFIAYPASNLSLGSHSVTVVAVDSLGASTTFGPLNFTVTTP